MKQSFYIKSIYLLCCVLFLLSVTCPAGSAALRRDYRVTLDYPTGMVAQGTAVLIKNYDNGMASYLEIKGWIKSDFAMSYYEYTIDGGKTWIKAEKAVISRPDVKSYCPNTYDTAGFEVTIDVYMLPRGTYDVFVRGYTEQGDVIEVAVMLDVIIGRADTHTTQYTEINLRAFEVQSGDLVLHANQPVVLGAYNLRNYQSADIILDQNATVTIGSTQDYTIPFVAEFSEITQNEDGTYTATLSLQDVTYAGDVQLQCAQDVKISRIRLYTYTPDYYEGDLKVYMTSTPYEYFSGANNVDAAIMTDDTVGTYTRLYPVNDTNDPYIYFNLGKYLKQTNEVQISATYYRYMVITLQTPAHNSNGLFRLFLCAGDIHGPHGESHVSFAPINDSKWHTYVIPLCEEDYWNGTVYGMRFDFIDGNVNKNDYANIASFSLHPDEQSAKEAAAQPLTQYYEAGNTPEEIYAEQGRAPSGRADAITWFDESLSSCFSGANKCKFYFDEYGHLMMQAIETTNDPYVSFNLQAYASLHGQSLLSTADYGVVVLRVRADKGIVGKNFVLYYYADGLDYAQGTRALGANFKGDKWEYLVYDMSGLEFWRQDILGFRLDFASQISTGQRVCLSDMLFFKDMNAWDAYASENGIVYGDEVPTDVPDTPAPETEAPTIEIPTQGAGLEYIPPEQMAQDQSGCNGALLLPVSVLLPLVAVALTQYQTKKGEFS